MREGGPLPGWGGGSFYFGGNVIGWDLKGETFWVHSFSCPEGQVLAAARLVQAVRKKAKELGCDRMYWQVIPDLTGSTLLKTLGKGRAKIDLVQMYLEV